MTFCSTQSNYFGKFQPKEKEQSRKKIISPILARENQALVKSQSMGCVATVKYNKQQILMPPVKKHLESKRGKTSANFLKVR